MTKSNTKTKATKNNATKGAFIDAPKKGKRGKAKAAEPEVKVIKGSVVPAHFKIKGGKDGVMRKDDLDQAVRNAFLAEGSSDIGPQAAARLATDAILEANGEKAGRWEKLNAGMLSMNLRNVLRGKRRNGLTVHVGSKKFGPTEA